MRCTWTVFLLGAYLAIGGASTAGQGKGPMPAGHPGLRVHDKVEAPVRGDTVIEGKIESLILLGNQTAGFTLPDWDIYLLFDSRVMNTDESKAVAADLKVGQTVKVLVNSWNITPRQWPPMAVGHVVVIQPTKN